MATAQRRLLALLSVLVLVTTGYAGIVTAEEAEDQESGVCVSAEDDVSCDRAAVSATGNATACPDDDHDALPAVTLLHAASPCIALSGTGDATANAWVAASGMGDAHGRSLAVSGTGNATASCSGWNPDLILFLPGFYPYGSPCFGLAGTGDAESDTAAISGTGDAYGDHVAASGLGHAGSYEVTLNPSESLGCTHHPPIQITENEGSNGFILDRDTPSGEPIYRPGSGVVAGNGTADNPYVIANWCISPPTLMKGLLIRNTTAHVTIENVYIGPNGLPYTNGLILSNAKHVSVRNSTIQANWNAAGVQVEESEDIRIVGNDLSYNIEGVEVKGSSGVRIASNHISASYQHAVDVEASHDIEVTHNELARNLAGVNLVDVEDSKVQHNTLVKAAGFGIRAKGTEAPLITDNTLTGTFHGILLNKAHRAVLLNNSLVEVGDTGIGILLSNETTLRENSLEGGSIGISSYISREPLVDHYEHTIPPSNTFNGEPVRYIRDQVGVDVVEPAGQVILVNTEQVRVKNVTVTDAFAGVQLAGTDNTTIANSTFTDTAFGVHSVRGSHERMLNNEIANQYWGVWVEQGTRTEIGGNTVHGSMWAAVRLASSSNMEVHSNDLGDRGLAITGDPSNPSHYRHEVDATNIVGGKPLLYMKDQVEPEVPPSAGQVILVNTTGARVDGLNLTGTYRGAFLAFAENSTVANTTFAHSVGTGLALVRSPNATIHNNTFHNNGVGARQEESPGGSLTHNTFEDNHGPGLVLAYASHADVEMNSFARNGWGIATWFSGANITHNNIYDTDNFGLQYSWGYGSVDARHNWWGHSTGPSGGVVDACTGSEANGLGDTIYAPQGGNICFDPWRTERVPGAGAMGDG